MVAIGSQISRKFETDVTDEIDVIGCQISRKSVTDVTDVKYIIDVIGDL